jgi:hypothetical protein
MSPDFQMAHKQARRRFQDNVWLGLSLHEKADAIYEELRAIDSARMLQEAAQLRLAAATDLPAAADLT